MKKGNVKLRWLIVAMIAMITLTGQDVMSQGSGRFRDGGRGQGYRQQDRDKEGPGERDDRPGYCRNIPGLTGEQEAGIEKSWLKFRKEANDLKNQVAEKRARLRTLSAADKPDQKAIDQLIDEKASLRAKIEKMRNQHQQEVRSLLTEEQRVYFDSEKGRGRGFGKGKHGGGRGGDCLRRD